MIIYTYIKKYQDLANIMKLILDQLLIVLNQNNQKTKNILIKKLFSIKCAKN